MSDEVKRIRGLRDEPEDTELTTADLATANRTARENDEPEVIEAEAVEISSVPVSNVSPRRVEINRSTATSAAAAAAAAAPAKEPETGPLFTNGEAGDLRARWDAIQVGFVDEPRQAVEQADNLVAGTMKRLAEIFAEERRNLESQWDQGEDVSTEDLRLALRRYRSFFSRLLSI